MTAVMRKQANPETTPETPQTTTLRARLRALTSAKQGWWLRRLAAFPLHVGVFALAVFGLVRILPGDPVLVASGGQPLTAEQYAEVQEKLGFSGTFFDQLGRFGAELARLDLGRSLQNSEPVGGLIAERLPLTLQLSVIALSFTIVLALVIALVVALFPRKVIGHILNGYARTAGAIPDFVIGLFFISVFYVILRVIPAPLGNISNRVEKPANITGVPLIDALIEGNFAALSSLSHYLLTPVLVLVIAYTPILARVLIEALVKELDAPATLFRVATGAPRSAVIRSAVRRAFPPAMPVVATIFGFMIGGALVVEQLFSMTGMGTLAVQAVKTNDITTLQGFLLVVGTLSLFVYLLTDLITMMLDARRRPGLAGAEE